MDDSENHERPAETPQIDRPKVEEDDRFPSGKWEGFFLMTHTGTKRHMMELFLTFSDGRISGDGRDSIGEFLIRGRYERTSGRCTWNKKYVKKHEVGYDGFNEGKGIFGRWEIQDVITWHGGFLIWPKGMGDPTKHRRQAAIDLPSGVGERSVVESGLATVSAESGDSVMDSMFDDP